MALLDLTPQLRTRLGRVERAVGLFVLLAAALMLFGFGYYLYHTARHKGWFLLKVPYFTLIDSAAGLKPGDPVILMGSPVGEITKVVPEPPEDVYFNVYVEFTLTEPNHGYIWSQGSAARVTSADFLGKRFIEVTKGTNGHSTYLFHDLKEIALAEAEGYLGRTNLALNERVWDDRTSNFVDHVMKPFTPEALRQLAAAGKPRVRLIDLASERKTMTGIWDDKVGVYQPYGPGSKPYWLLADESPALTERLEQFVGKIEAALPNVLDLTNKLALVLSNSASLTAHADALMLEARPAVTNLALITANLRDPHGALGEWLIPTNLHRQLESTMTSANSTLTNADLSLTLIVSNLNLSLEHLADLTGNLNAQVQTNDQILTEVSRAVVHADEMVQGLKRHWLLRSAFKGTNAPPKPKGAKGKP